MAPPCLLAAQRSPAHEADPDLLKIGDVPGLPVRAVLHPPKSFCSSCFVFFHFPRVPGQPVARPIFLSCSVPCSDTSGCVNLCRPDDHLSRFPSPQRPGGRSCCSFPVPSEGCAHYLLASRFRNTSNDTEESSDLPVTWPSNPELGLWVVKCADAAGHCSFMTPDSSFSSNSISQHRTFIFVPGPVRAPAGPDSKGCFMPELQLQGGW